MPAICLAVVVGSKKVRNAWSALCGGCNWPGYLSEGSPPSLALRIRIHGCRPCVGLLSGCTSLFSSWALTGVFAFGVSVAFVVLMALGNMSVTLCLLRGGWSVGELAGKGQTHLGSHPIFSISRTSAG